MIGNKKFSVDSRIMGLPIILAFSFVLAGCEGIDEYGSKESYFVVAESGGSPSDKDMEIILGRAWFLRDQWFSSIEGGGGAAKRKIVLENEAFNDGERDCVSGRVGVMKIYLDDPEDPWLDQSSIESASVSKIDGFYFLDLSIKSQEARKMSRLSRENVGRKVTLSIDDQVVTIATIQAELGKRFRVTMESEDKAKCQAAVLSGGPLSQAFWLVRPGST